MRGEYLGAFLLGKYYAETISDSYTDFNFGQKKEPSRWITFLVTRVEKRVAGINSGYNENDCKSGPTDTIWACPVLFSPRSHNILYSFSQ
jgi:hypothetical protein